MQHIPGCAAVTTLSKSAAVRYASGPEGKFVPALPKTTRPRACEQGKNCPERAEHPAKVLLLAAVGCLALVLLIGSPTGLMISALFNQPNYVGAKKMLDATVLRHNAIARNIANVETPRYRRVDIAPTFQSEFQKALQSQSAGQIERVEPGLAVDMKAVPVSRDGNTVNLEDELLQLSQNTMQHALETQLISGALLKMRLAITGKP